MSNNSKGYKVLIGVIAFISSFLCAGFVYGYVTETGFSFGWQFLFRFAATVAVISNIWMIIALFCKRK